MHPWEGLSPCRPFSAATRLPSPQPIASCAYWSRTALRTMSCRWVRVGAWRRPSSVWPPWRPSTSEAIRAWATRHALSKWPTCARSYSQWWLARQLRLRQQRLRQPLLLLRQRPPRLKPCPPGGSKLTCVSAECRLRIASSALTFSHGLSKVVEGFRQTRASIRAPCAEPERVGILQHM